MTEYEFRCEGCGVFVLSSHPAGECPEFDKSFCVVCDKAMEHRRWYAFGVPPGSSGEGFRSSGHSSGEQS